MVRSARWTSRSVGTVLPHFLSAARQTASEKQSSSILEAIEFPRLSKALRITHHWSNLMALSVPERLPCLRRICGRACIQSSDRNEDHNSRTITMYGVRGPPDASFMVDGWHVEWRGDALTSTLYTMRTNRIDNRSAKKRASWKSCVILISRLCNIISARSKYLQCSSHTIDAKSHTPTCLCNGHIGQIDCKYFSSIRA